MIPGDTYCFFMVALLLFLSLMMQSMVLCMMVFGEDQPLG